MKSGSAGNGRHTLRMRTNLHACCGICVPEQNEFDVLSSGFVKQILKPWCKSWTNDMTVARQVWGFIERRDHRLMRRLNRWRAPRWIRIWMIAATRLGDGWLWYSLAALLLVFGGPQRFTAVSAAASAALTGVAVFKILKTLSHRQRPCQLEPHCWSKVLPPDKFSFPSGHTMTAFSIALVLCYFYRGVELPLGFFACSIAVSRIVLGMHFLSDVLAGAVIGVGLGCASLTAFAAMGFI